VTFARILPHMQRALRGENAVCEITHEDSGRRIRVALTPDPGVPDRGGARSGGGIYILSTDITEETQARAELMQTRKRELAAQLTSGLAHDFSNLLTIILGLQGKLAQAEALPPGALETVRATLAAARRGGTLLQRIGEISGNRALRPQPTDLEPLLDDLSMMATPSLPDRTRLRIDLAPALGRLMLDQGAVQDSLLNLILNARDAMGARGGTIRLGARPVRDTWLELMVEDDGPGFSDEALKRGMDPFFTTKGGEGSGLGLAMVYDHASLSGGSVRLANRPEGGARVTLRLPLRPALDAPAGEKRLVLLVEDSPELRTHVREMLCALGHQVIEAETAADALTLAAIPEIGFVLSDIQLAGGATGLELLEGLTDVRPGLPSGLMTSLPASDALHARAAARFAVLPKPFDPGDLEAFIQTCAAAPGTVAAQ
jgi:signal transduction histidine kinase